MINQYISRKIKFRFRELQIKAYLDKHIKGFIRANLSYNTKSNKTVVNIYCWQDNKYIDHFNQFLEGLKSILNENVEIIFIYDSNFAIRSKVLADKIVSNSPNLKQLYFQAQRLTNNLLKYSQARGSIIRIKGKFNGQRKNIKIIKKGQFKYTGFQNLNRRDIYTKTIETKMGIMGLTVKIYV